MRASVLPNTRTMALEGSKQPSLPITANKTQPYIAKSEPMLRSRDWYILLISGP